MGMYGLISVVLVIVPLWRICSRAGFNGAIALVTLIPVVGLLIVGFILSFCTWPQPKRGRGD